MILKGRVVNINMRYIVQPANDMYDDDRWAGAILLRSHVAQPRGASSVLRVNATRHVTRCLVRRKLDVSVPTIILSVMVVAVAVP